MLVKYFAWAHVKWGLSMPYKAFTNDIAWAHVKWGLSMPYKAFINEIEAVI